MNNKYNQVGDFLQDDLFVKWVLYNESPLFWEDFLKKYPSQIEAVEEAKRLILALYESEDTQYDAAAFNKTKVWQQISRQLAPPNPETRLLPFWRDTTFRWVASVFLVLGVLVAAYWQPKQQQISYTELVNVAKKKSPLRKEVAALKTSQRVLLEDGTIVWLERGSLLSYPVHFQANKREVVLMGEAYFEVARNPNQPFYVYSNEVVTRVIGTIFKISAFENSRQVSVSVMTGKVSVFSQKRIDIDDPETEGLVLLPNQQAVFDRSEEIFNKSLVEAPLPIESPVSLSKQKYEEVPVKVVFDALEKRYGVKIIYDENLLSDCILTTTLQNTPLYEQLDLICQTIGASYKEIDAQLIIESKGCK